MKNTQMARMIRALGKQAQATINGHALFIIAPDAWMYMTCSAFSSEPVGIPADLVPELFGDTVAVVMPGSLTRDDITHRFKVSEPTMFDMPAMSIHAQRITRTDSAWLAAGTDSAHRVPILSNVIARDGLLFGTDRFRAHAISCPDTWHGHIPGALMSAFGEFDLVMSTSGTWQAQGEIKGKRSAWTWQAQGTGVGDAPNLGTVISKAREAQRFPLGVDIQDIISKAGKLPKDTHLTLTSDGAIFADQSGAPVVTIQAPAPAVEVRVNPAFMASARLDGWTVAGDRDPLIAEDGHRVALVMPQRR